MNKLNEIIRLFKFAVLSGDENIEMKTNKIYEDLKTAKKEIKEQREKEVIMALDWAYEKFNLGFMENKIKRGMNEETFGHENYNEFINFLNNDK